MYLYEKLDLKKSKRLNDNDWEKLLALIKKIKDQFPEYMNYDKSVRKGRTCNGKTHFIKRNSEKKKCGL